MRPQLENNWPNLNTAKRNNQNFWPYQWRTHGTCSTKKFNQYDYFKLSLNIKNSWDILSVLQKAGYGPNPIAKYNSIDVSEAIKDKIGQVEPELHCITHSTLNIVILTEVVLCLDADGVTNINCPTAISGFHAQICHSNHFQLLP